MKNAALRVKLCKRFCIYYKPSKNEDTACMGFLAVERLIESGRKIIFDKPKTKIDKTIEKSLKESLCTTCSFYERDCDFAEGKDEAVPCGGFMLLGHLITVDIICIDDIRNIN